MDFFFFFPKAINFIMKLYSQLCSSAIHLGIQTPQIQSNLLSSVPPVSPILPEISLNFIPYSLIMPFFLLSSNIQIILVGFFFKF